MPSAAEPRSGGGVPQTVREMSGNRESSGNFTLSREWSPCMYLLPFLRYLASKNGETLKLRIGSFKVIENGAII